MARDLQKRRVSNARYREKNREREAERNRVWREQNRERVAANNRAYRRRHPDSNMKYQYGLDMAGYNVLLESQGGVCAICKKPGKLVVDHDHQTLKVRGLLHQNCNKALGMLEDNPSYMESAAAYLRQER